ncbi:N-acetyldiaminopimelate deacetylase, partial [Lactobacillus reuteri]|nr:N-acetyldiaminopimelate deacetylase [Limosilactobacillus reuteri]
MLTEEELIQIRRHLHQIPELALQEFDTHQYLVETIAGFNQAFLEVRTFKELPTALM